MTLSTPQQAVAFAAAQHSWPVGMCDYFAAACYGLQASGYNTALDHWNACTETHPGDANAPYGALVFWGNGEGHVALSTGDGYIWSTDISGNGTVSHVPLSEVSTNWGKPYLGWAVPQFQNQFAVLTGGTMLSADDILKIWGYKGNDLTGPADNPDVHQSLLTTRDNSAALVAAVASLTSLVNQVKAEVDAIKTKLGA